MPKLLQNYLVIMVKISAFTWFKEIFLGGSMDNNAFITSLVEPTIFPILLYLLGICS